MMDVSILFIAASVAVFAAALVVLFLAYKKVSAASLMLGEAKDRLKN